MCYETVLYPELGYKTNGKKKKIIFLSQLNTKNTMNTSSNSYNMNTRYKSKTNGGKGNKMFGFLSEKKTDHLGITLNVLSAVILVMALFLTMLATRTFTSDDLEGNWSKVSGVIKFCKTQTGMVLIALLWAMFIITFVPCSVGQWMQNTMISVL